MELHNNKNISYKERIKLKRLDLLNSVPLPGPLTVHIEPTNVCNFKCKICPVSLDSYEEKADGLHSLSLEDFELIKNELKTLPKLKSLNFFMMGEPLVNKNLSKFIKSATENDLSEWYMVSSNGALLSDEKYQNLCESGLDFLRISVFGSDEQSHANVTQSKIKLERVRDNLKKFQDYKKTNGFNSPRTMAKLIDTEDKSRNKKFLDLFDGVGDETIIEPLTNWNDPLEGSLSEHYSSSSEKKDGSYLMNTDHYKNKKKTCSYVFYSLVIHSDLKVSICCVDWEKKTLIGDLKKEKLIDIWNGEKLKEIQLLHIRKQKDKINVCKNCSYLHTAKDNVDSLTEEQFLSR